MVTKRVDYAQQIREMDYNKALKYLRKNPKPRIIKNPEKYSKSIENNPAIILKNLKKIEQFMIEDMRKIVELNKQKKLFDTMMEQYEKSIEKRWEEIKKYVKGANGDISTLWIVEKKMERFEQDTKEDFKKIKSSLIRKIILSEIVKRLEEKIKKIQEIKQFLKEEKERA